MKDFFRKYIHFFVYVLLIGILLQLFFFFSEYLFRYILLLLSFFLTALLIRRLFLLIRKKTAQIYMIIKSIVDKYKLRKYENLLRASSESWRIRGRDAGKLKLRVGLAEKIRSVLNIRTRLTLKIGASNREKVRYIFTRLILERSRDKEYVEQSSTPRELIDHFTDEKDAGAAVLADAYEQARYSDDVKISDETVSQCDTLIKNTTNRRL